MVARSHVRNRTGSRRRTRAVLALILTGSLGFGACTNERHTASKGPKPIPTKVGRSLRIPSSRAPTTVEILLAEPDSKRIESVTSRLIDLFQMAPSAATAGPNGSIVYRHATSGAEVGLNTEGFVRYYARGSNASPAVIRHPYDSEELMGRAKRLLESLGLNAGATSDFAFARREPGGAAKPNQVFVFRLVRGLPVVFAGSAQMEVHFTDELNVDRLELALWKFETLTPADWLPSSDVFGSDPIEYFNTDWVASPVLAAVPVQANAPHRWAIVPAWDSTIPTWSPSLAITTEKMNEIQRMARTLDDRAVPSTNR
jgi:hypothetical protein